MKPNPMSVVHQAVAAPWSWPVAGTAQRLPAAPQARWLAVREGRVWLTRSRHQAVVAIGADDDVWLQAGQRHLLPAGSDWVLEAWPAAQLELLQAPPRVSQPDADRARWLAPFWQAVQAVRAWRARRAVPAFAAACA